MKRYKDELTPREIKKGFYRNIELGKDVVLQRIEISNQIRDMIVSHVGLAGTTNSNRNAISAGVNFLTYNNRNLGNGIYGLKAAFEWNIAEVAWQIEQNVKEFRDMLKILYASLEPSFAKLRFLAQKAYEEGRIADAVDNFLKISQRCKNDFSVFLSLGIISIFHEKDKEKALAYFDEAIEIAKSQSDYYTSYVLIYKALVLRNLDRLEEAEEFSKQAVDLSPDFTEALYQNAQYSALLKKTDTVISLLKKVIRIDILYCLKITNERDFNGIKSHIIKAIEETSVPLDEGIKSKLKKLDEKLYCLNTVINSMHKQGLEVSDNQNAKQLQGDKDELANIVNYNSVLNTFVVDRCLTQLDKNLQHDKSQLLSECKHVREKVGSERKEAARALKKVKEKKLFSPFLLYLFISQLYAIPVGIFVIVPPGILIAKYNILIGIPLGIPPGVFVMETIAIISCVLIVFVPTIRPRIKWKKIHTSLQHRELRLA